MRESEGEVKAAVDALSKWDKMKSIWLNVAERVVAKQMNKERLDLKRLGRGLK